MYIYSLCSISLPEFYLLILPSHTTCFIQKCLKITFIFNFSNYGKNAKQIFLFHSYCARWRLLTIFQCTCNDFMSSMMDIPVSLQQQPGSQGKQSVSVLAPVTFRYLSLGHSVVPFPSRQQNPMGQGSGLDVPGYRLTKILVIRTQLKTLNSAL